jgi:hypothetical protein
VAVDINIICKASLDSTNDVTANLEGCQVAGGKCEGGTLMRGLPSIAVIFGVTRAEVASCLRYG